MFLGPQPNFLIAVFLTVMSIGSSTTPAQKGEEAHYVVAGVDCNDDEQTKAILDHASIDAQKDERIFIIARLGTGESSRSLSRRRLHAPRHYVMKTRGIPENRIIVPEAGRVKGLGQVEVYLGGKLFALFKMKRNRDFGQGPLCKIIFD